MKPRIFNRFRNPIEALSEHIISTLILHTGRNSLFIDGSAIFSRPPSVRLGRAEYFVLGMIFTEFVDMVDETFSAEIVDELLDDRNGSLPSGGAYTTVGYYSHEEMLTLVGRLSRMTHIPAEQLVYRYGKHLFQRFLHRYPRFFDMIDGTFVFLEQVHGHIHVEVRKLYGEAKPPSLICRREGPSRMIVDYASERPFAMLAHGLVDGCIDHYREPIDIDVVEMAPDGRSARFALDRRGGEPERERRASEGESHAPR